MSLNHYSSIAELFVYPDSNYISNIKKCIETLSESHPEASKKLEEFLKPLPTQTSDLQELYEKAFEVQAITSLEIGYVLYGDDYTRGLVMSNLNNEHKKVANDCRGELPDHLSNVLTLIPKMEDREILNDLVVLMLAPAVEIMIKEFHPTSIDNKKELYKKQYKTIIESSYPATIFLHLLEALYSMLENDFTLEKEKQLFADASFFKFLKNELEVEEGKKSTNSCSMSFNPAGIPTSSCSVN